MFKRTMILAVSAILVLPLSHPGWLEAAPPGSTEKQLPCFQFPSDGEARLVVRQIGKLLFGQYPVAPGDPGSVLRGCAAVCASLPDVVHVTFRQDHGAWRPTSLDCNFGDVRVTDAVVAPLARFTTLERLNLATQRADLDAHRLSARGIRGLASPGDLRHLGLPWGWIESDLAPVCTFTMLESLDLRDMYWRRSASDDLDRLKDLHKLRELGLQYGKLNDESVDRILALTGLEELTLSGNDQISDAALAKLKALRNLRVLAIQRLGPKTLSAIRQMPRLEHLSINEYRPLPETADLSVLTGIKWLTIRDLRPEQPVRIRLPATLRRLDVENKHVRILDFQLSTHIECLQLDVAERHNVFAPSDYTPLDSKWLASLRDLRELTLIDPMADNVKAIAGLDSLRTLTLKTLQWAGVEDEGMRMLAGLRQLESLTVEDYCRGEVGNRPINEGLDVLVKLPKLRRLALIGFPKVTAKGLANVWRLTRLRALRLSLFTETAGLVGDDALARIGAMSELEELSIGESGGTVTDKGLKNLASLTKLRRLDLGSCGGYTDEALASLMRALPDLQEVKRTYRPHAKEGTGKR